MLGYENQHVRFFFMEIFGLFVVKNKMFVSNLNPVDNFYSMKKLLFHDYQQRSIGLPKVWKPFKKEPK